LVTTDTAAMLRACGLHGYHAHQEPPPPLGPPQMPRRRATVESTGGGVSYERGTPCRVQGSEFLERDSTERTSCAALLTRGPQGLKFRLPQGGLLLRLDYPQA
jgi:hypothetical protein